MEPIVQSTQDKPARQYTYSEVFNSIQGEGYYTGTWTLWVRFFLCNLQCDGFGQIDPTRPDTYDLPYKDFDPKSVNRVEDLPVWDKGCDSSYTWSKKFKHLMGRATAAEILQKIKNTAKDDLNPLGSFHHPISKQTAHLCITGGEPLMKHAQMAALEFSEAWHWDYHKPKCVTWETNGTQAFLPEFREALMNRGVWNVPVFFSVSPKLWTVAGEKREKAIKPEIVQEYYKISTIVNNDLSPGRPSGQLKFVMGPKKEQWEEMEEVLAMFREKDIDWPVYIMPVGATVEEQETSAGEVAEIAFKRGYNVSGRLHCYLFGNAIGT